jgi:hypothetical protein
MNSTDSEKYETIVLGQEFLRYVYTKLDYESDKISFKARDMFYQDYIDI